MRRPGAAAASPPWRPSDDRSRGEITTTRSGTEEAIEGARLRRFQPCGKDRRIRDRSFLVSIFASGRRCRSSVVEHPLGKGEVVSSILTGSTILTLISSAFLAFLTCLTLCLILGPDNGA